MIIHELKISHLRNLTTVDIELAKGLNFFYGSNGSGKTSIIEAAYLLGRGKTFREVRQENIIQDGQDQAIIFARMLSIRAAKQTIGFIKNRKGAEISIDGYRESRISKLANHFPVNIITPKSHEIIEAGPNYRRKFLDWAVFHVEPSYKDCIARYQKLLRERNYLLKSDHSLLPYWESSLENEAISIDNHRSSYLHKLTAYFEDILSKFLNIPNISLIYQKGYEKSTSLGLALEKRRSSDIERGFTSVGPHRADLKIISRQRLAKSRVSRGQQKIITAALVLAQIQLLKEQTGKSSLLLIDDLAAELDDENRKILISTIRSTDVQTFITSTSEGVFDNYSDDGVFHVEQGAVCAV